MAGDDGCETIAMLSLTPGGAQVEQSLDANLQHLGDAGSLRRPDAVTIRLCKRPVNWRFPAVFGEGQLWIRLLRFFLYTSGRLQ